MRIKKILDAVGLVGNVLNQKSSSKKDAYSCDYVNKLNTYSEEEQIVGFWIDGKPLYRKVYDCGKLSNGGKKETPTNLSNVNYIDWECVAIASGGSAGYPLKMAHTGNDYAAKVEIVGNVIRITINGDLSEYTGYATILYTKN
jgi:hypothetical protein